jgi:hypothetical protein
LWRALLAASAAAALVPLSARTDLHGTTEHGKSRLLYIWAGDQARTAPGFLTVVNFDEASRDYGKVIRVAPLPPPGNTGNEPHHMHLSADKRTLRLRSRPFPRPRWR